MMRVLGDGSSLALLWLDFSKIKPLLYEQTGMTEDNGGPSSLGLVQGLQP